MNLLDLFESAHGNDCHLCKGTGEGLFDGESCPVCDGTGIEPKSRNDDDVYDTDDYDDTDYGDEESYYEKSLRNRGLGEAAGDIGQAIKAAYKKIYDQGDDAVEFAYYDSPIFAQYWDEYEGDLDSIIAEVDPSELQIILDELTSAAEDQGLAEGNPIDHDWYRKQQERQTKAKQRQQGVAEGFDDVVKGVKRYVKGKPSKSERETHHANRTIGAAQAFHQTSDPTEKDYIKQQMFKHANRYYKVKDLPKKDVEETRVGNRMSDMAVGSPKIVYKGGRAVGEIGLDHDPSPGQGPFYMKHYDTNTWYSGYDTKKEALSDLKHVVDQMNEGEKNPFEKGSMGHALWRDLSKTKKASPAQQQRNRERFAKRDAEKAKQQGVEEAAKKKDDQTRDVSLRRAFTKARGAFPTAASDIEALAKDLLRSQDQDQQDFEKIRAVDQEQQRMLAQIAQVDQNQTQEIDNLEQDNSTLKRRLQQMQAVNARLEKTLASMSGRKKEKAKEPAPDVGADTFTAPASTPDTPVSTSKPKSKGKGKSQPAKPATSKAIGSVAKSLSGPSTSPAFDRISKELQPRQKELGFDEPNIIEPTIKRKKVDTSRASDAEYRELTGQLAKKLATDPEMKNQMYKPDALRNLVGQEEMPLENKDPKPERPEADYDDKYQSMVSRVGQKARKQEQSKPVDIADLARRLAAIEASKKE